MMKLIMSKTLLTFLTIVAAVSAQGNLGRLRLTDTSQSELLPPVHFNTTTNGAALIAAYNSYVSTSASFQLTSGPALHTALKNMIMALGVVHVENFNGLNAAVEAYKSFFSRVRNADAIYKQRYSDLSVQLSSRMNNNSVIAQYNVLLPQMTLANSLVVNLRSLNNTLWSSRFSLGQTYQNFTLTTDQLLNSISQIVSQQNTDMQGDLAAVSANLTAFITPLLTNLQSSSDLLKNNINGLYNALSNNYANAVPYYLSQVVGVKANQLGGLAQNIGNQITALNADQNSFSQAFGVNTTALIADFNTFVAAQAAIATPVLGAASTSNLMVSQAKINRFIGIYRSVTSYTPYLNNVFNYASKYYQFVRSKIDFDLTNLVNYMAAYTSQVNQIQANYESMGLFINQMARQINPSIGTTYVQGVATVVFRLGEWTPIQQSEFPLSVPATFSSRFSYFKVLLKAVDTAFTASAQYYRTHVKNDDRSFSFELIDQVKFSTVATDPAGLYCYIAVSDPIAAQEKVSCTVQFSTPATTPANLPAPTAVTPTFTYSSFYTF